MRALAGCLHPRRSGELVLDFINMHPCARDASLKKEKRKEKEARFELTRSILRHMSPQFYLNVSISLRLSSLVMTILEGNHAIHYLLRLLPVQMPGSGSGSNAHVFNFLPILDFAPSQPHPILYSSTTTQIPSWEELSRPLLDSACCPSSHDVGCLAGACVAAPRLASVTWMIGIAGNSCLNFKD
jgi:hypothetical protein